MENGIVIFYNGQVLTTIVVHRTELKPLSEILDYYAEEFGFERKRISGTRTVIVDITDVQYGQAHQVGYAKNDWPLSAKGK